MANFSAVVKTKTSLHLQHGHDFFEEMAVGMVEGVEFCAVDVEDGNDVFALLDGHDDFASRQRGAGDVAGELVDVGQLHTCTLANGRVCLPEGNDKGG